MYKFENPDSPNEFVYLRNFFEVFADRPRIELLKNLQSRTLTLKHVDWGYPGENYRRPPE